MKEYEIEKQIALKGNKYWYFKIKDISFFIFWKFSVEYTLERSKLKWYANLNFCVIWKEYRDRNVSFRHYWQKITAGKMDFGEVLQEDEVNYLDLIMAWELSEEADDQGDTVLQFA